MSEIRANVAIRNVMFAQCGAMATAQSVVVTDIHQTSSVAHSLLAIIIIRNMLV